MHLIDNNASAWHVLPSEGTCQPGGFIHAQRGGYRGDDKLCLLLVSEQVPHHCHAALQWMNDGFRDQSMVKSQAVATLLRTTGPGGPDTARDRQRTTDSKGDTSVDMQLVELVPNGATLKSDDFSHKNDTMGISEGQLLHRLPSLAHQV